MPAQIVFDHIAIGTHRIADAAPFLEGELGGRSAGGGPSPGFNFWQWEFAGGGRIEVLEPVPPKGGFMHRFLEDRGPGLHHVTFKVPDLDGVCTRAEEAGFQIVGRNEESPDWKEAFLHPKQALGIVVQIAQSSGGDLAGPYPFTRDVASDSATVWGLRMQARDVKSVRKQWVDVLGGRIVGDGATEGVELAWPDSPLRLQVDIDEGLGAREVGPTAIQLRARGTAGVLEPEGLGTRFVS